ncbi:glycoside hydrolase N-terminal domain-containing protein, partial [Streptomyces sp. NPDC005373]|uniref:glycoside hydrolase N-terminal domain-containing protein n=1 Tax=Streptomyces sp. NPDC005373 TaxID=3156879 RepID=UPI0033B1AFA9
RPSGGDTTSPTPAPVALPDRGIHDTAPADAWTDGFLTGNGEYGAVVYGDPALEKIVLDHHCLVLPNGTRDVTPPVLADRLEAVRDKALAGDYAGAVSWIPRSGSATGAGVGEVVSPPEGRTECMAFLSFVWRRVTVRRGRSGSGRGRPSPAGGRP